MRIVFVDLVRLIIIILFLPVLLILIGPLLILAVIRGRQPMGPIILNTARYNGAVRVGLFVLGLAVWLLVWGGLAWLGAAAISPPTLAQISQPSPTPMVAPELASPSPSPSLAETPTGAAAPTLTPVPTETPPAPPATPTLTPTTSPTPELASTPSHTPATELQATPTATLRPTTPSPTATPTITPTIGATLSVDEQSAAVRVVREANTLLRASLALANEENLAGLRIVWQDKASIITKNFAAELYNPDARPFTLDFEYMVPPTVSAQNSDNEIIITSREKWRYDGPTRTHLEAFEFFYTLIRQEGRWLAISYTYRSVKLPTPEPPTATPPRWATPIPTPGVD